MAAQQPGGWAEIEAAVREAVQDWRPGQGETILGRVLAALRPAWERHAAQLAAARRELEDPGVQELWHRTGLADARAELAAAGAREARLREALREVFELAHEPGVSDFPGDPPLRDGYDEIAEVADAALAAAPVPAGGLLELIDKAEEAGRFHREREDESDFEDRHRHRELAEVAEGWSRRLRECAGLPPREGA
jgi:hypothetical protein